MRKMIRSLVIIFVLIISLLGGCAEKPKEIEEKVYKVGILSGLDFLEPTIDGFKEKMVELGYVEGKNIVYDVKKTDFDPPTEKRILDKWVSNKFDLIFTSPTEVSQLAKDATKGTDIPVLFANALIEGSGLVETVKNPSGNITGIRYPAPDIAIKSLEILLEVAPEAKRIWLPYLDGYPTIPSQLEKLRPAATAFEVTVLEFPANNVEEIKAELKARNESPDPGIDAIMHMAEPFATMPDAIAVISEFVAEHNLAYHGTGGKCVFILTVDPFDVGKLAAFSANKILNGTPAGTIPVVSADPVLTINYNVAMELGLTIPEGLLARANKIIR